MRVFVAVVGMLALAHSGAAQAQTPIIDTWAGGGPLPGAPAVSVSIPGPNSVALDPAGNYYIASTTRSEDGRIFKVTPAGAIALFAGGGSAYGTTADGGPALEANLGNARFLAHRDGALYLVAAPGVRRIDIDAGTGAGTMETVVGGGSQPFTNGMWASEWDAYCIAGLALAPAPAAEMYVTDACDQTVKRVDSAGRVWIVAGQPNVPGYTGDGGPASAATFNYIRDVALAPNGDLAVIDQGRQLESRVVRRIAAGADGVVDGDQDETIGSLTIHGCCNGAADGDLAIEADLRGHQAIAFDTTSLVLLSVAYEGPGQLWRIDGTGRLHLLAGADGRSASLPGPPGYGDGGPAREAQFGRIGGILALPDWVVVADDTIPAVRRTVPAGSYATVARVAGNGLKSLSGDGAPVAGSQLFEPRNIVFGTSGNAYITDQQGTVLRFFDGTTGNISSIAPPLSPFTPSAVAIHPVTDEIYFSNGDNRIWAFLPPMPAREVAGTGQATCSWDCQGGDPRDDLKDDGPALEATFRSIVSLAFDAQANLYAADSGNHRVRRVDAATGVITTVAGIDIAGNGGYAGDGGPAVSARLRYPRVVAFGPDGSLYISDYSNARIRRVEAGADGEVTGAGDETINTLVSSYSASGLAVDATGRLFYTGDSNHDVRLWESGATAAYVNASRIAGFSGDRGPALDAWLRGPRGLALDAAGSLYIADTLNSRIRVVTVQTNQRPVADPQSVTTAYGQPVVITLTGSDPEGAPLTFSVAATLAGGTLTGTAPDLVYTPNQGYYGTESFTFTVSDGQETSPPATVTVTVVGAPDLAVSKVIVDRNFTPPAELTAAAVGNGDVVEFKLTVVNRGVATVGATEVLDLLVAALNFVPAGSDPRCSLINAFPDVLICVEPGTLDGGSSTVFTIMARANPYTAALGSTVALTNRATVGSPADGNPANDASSNVVTLSVSPRPGAPTPAGIDVQVQPLDEGGAPQPISLRFPEVTAAGLTSAAVAHPAPPLPPGFQLKGQVYEIVTTASFTPPVRVCFNDPALNLGVNDRILHFESGAWVELPNQQLNPPTGPPFTETCAETNTLSPFAVATQPTPNLVATLYVESAGHPGTSATVGNGETVEFLLRVRNHGSAATTGPITVTDDLPAGLDFVPGASDAACSAAGQAVTCTAAGPLATDGELLLRLQAQVGPGVAAAGQTVELVNTMRVTTANDSSAADDTSTASVFVRGGNPPNLQVRKCVHAGDACVGGATVANGATVRFRILVDNFETAGQAPAGPTVAPFTVTDTLPAELSFVPAGSDPRCSAVGQTVTCAEQARLARMAPSPGSGRQEFLVVARVGAGVADFGETVDLVNTATVATYGDSFAGDDASGPATITVAGGSPPNLEMRKLVTGPAGARDSVLVGNGATVEFLLEVRNRGAGPTVGPISVTDTLPVGLSFVAADSDAACDGDGQAVTCTAAGPLAPNDPGLRFRVFALVASDVAAVGQTVTLVNAATVATFGDTSAVDDTSSASVFVLGGNPPNLRTRKCVDTGDACVGGATVANDATVRFRILVDNFEPAGQAPAGPTVAPFTVTDVLPAGLSFVPAASDERCAAAGQSVTCSGNRILSRLPPGPGGAQEEFLVVARVGARVADFGKTVDLVNTATVATYGDSFAGDDASGPATVTVDGGSPPNLAVRKFIEGPAGPRDSISVGNGQTVTFLLDVRNHGAGPTVGPVTVTDTLPAGLSFVAAGSDAACSAAGREVTCTAAGPVAPASLGLLFRFFAQVAPDVAGPGQTAALVNVATVSTFGDASAADDVSGPVTVYVAGENPPNLQIVKFGEDPHGFGYTSHLTVPNGGTVVFVLGVSNFEAAGQPPAGTTVGPVQVLDELPPGLVFVAAGSDPRCTASGQAVRCVDEGRLGRRSPDPRSPQLRFFVAAQVGASVSAPGESTDLVNVATVSTFGDAYAGDNLSGPVTIHVQELPGALTQAGSAVTVRPTDLNGTPGPITVTFAGVGDAGYTTAVPQPAGAPPPSNFRIDGTVYEIATTASYTPPVKLCFSGSFTDRSRILHFEGGQWVKLPNQQRLPAGGPPFTLICAQTDALSPFAVATELNQPPAADAGPDQTVEAAMPSGASVILAGSGSDPDGDPPAYSWSGPCGSASTATATFTCPLGTSVMTLAVSDGQGGTAQDSVSVTVRDTTPPEIAVAAPRDGAALVLRQSVKASFNCSDVASGVASCVGTVGDGASLDTSWVGSRTFTVTGTDAAGNTATVTRVYRVRFATGKKCLREPGHAILPPIAADGSSVFEQGLEVPARFRVCDAKGASVGTPKVVRSFRLVRVLSKAGARTVNLPVPSARPWKEFRWDAASRRWHYYIATKQLKANAGYGFRITLVDDSYIDFRFRLRNAGGQ